MFVVVCFDQRQYGTESSLPGAALTPDSPGTLSRVKLLNLRITGCQDFSQSLWTSTPRWAGQERQGSVLLLPGLSPELLLVTCDFR